MIYCAFPHAHMHARQPTNQSLNRDTYTHTPAQCRSTSSQFVIVARGEHNG